MRRQLPHRVATAGISRSNRGVSVGVAIFPSRIETVSHPNLLTEFTDASLRRSSIEPLLAYPFFEPLKNPSPFAQAFITHSTITWPGDIDIAPETLWIDSVRVG